MTADARISFWRANGLGIVLMLLFLAILTGQALAGHAAWNGERLEQGAPALSFLAYLASGHFVSATFENWESEFLQMGMYVVLTVWLRQRGSAESRPLHESEEQDRIEPGPTPWPVRRGGWAKRVYANSLCLAFLLLFAVSFALHLDGSWRHALEERSIQGLPPISLAEHFTGATFWFESLQNWQSEFLAVLAIVLLSIALRQDKSPQSKAVEAPHRQTGT